MSTTTSPSCSRSDQRTFEFTRHLDDVFLAREIRYVNNPGNVHSDPTPLLLAHLFNHQTYHRARVQAMPGQLMKPTDLDFHRALRPAPVISRPVPLLELCFYGQTLARQALSVPGVP